MITLNVMNRTNISNTAILHMEAITYTLLYADIELNISVHQRTRGGVCCAVHFLHTEQLYCCEAEMFS